MHVREPASLQRHERSARGAANVHDAKHWASAGHPGLQRAHNQGLMSGTKELSLIQM